MNQNKKIPILKLGIIGSGWVADQRHIPAFKKSRNVQVKAIYSLNRNEAENLAKKYKIPEVFSDLKLFLNSPIDCVSICTPPFTHAELIHSSLMAGKHVLVEKPMVMTAEEGKKLEKLAQEKNLILMPSHNFLFCDSVLIAKKIYESGKLGEILGTGGIQWSSWRRTLPKWFKELPGGLFFDESPHLIYLTKYFIGELHIEKVWKKSSAINEEPLERFEIVLRGEKAEGTLSMWFGAPISEWVFYIHGREGTIIIDIFRDIIYFLPKEVKRPPIYLVKTIIKGFYTSSKRMFQWALRRYIFQRKNLFGTDYIVTNFINSILGIEKPFLSPKDGWEVVKIINDILNYK
jgi:predicted dehydrogenase